MDLEQANGRWHVFLYEGTLLLTIALCPWFGMTQVNLEKQLTKTGMVVLSSQFHEPEQNVLILVSSHQYKVPVLSTQGFFPWFNASLAFAGRSLKSQGLISFVHKVSKFL